MSGTKLKRTTVFGLLLLPLFVIAADSSHEKMVQLLKRIQQETPDTNPILGDKKLRTLREEKSKLGANATAEQLGPLLLDLGEQELRQGNVEAAIDSLTQADNIFKDPANSKFFSKEAEITSAYRLAIAYLRLGETQNCAARHTAQSCILPLREGGIHSIKEGSTKARVHFERVLKLAPQDSPAYLKAKWLLNIAHMTLGEYPQKVSSASSIPETAFAAEQPFKRFANVAPALGLNALNLAGGVIADDFDNDGWLDLLVSTYDPGRPLQLFRNRGNFTFSNQTAQANLSNILGGFNLVQADYNNDGFVDVLVLRGAWLGKGGLFPKSLLRNNGNGTFTDVTFDSGLGEANYPSQTASWADYDHDGDLDLYIGNENAYGIVAPCQLFRNEGNGKFTDVAQQAGVTNFRFAKSVIWGDYDSDRDPDLYVSNLGQPNRLYRNNGNGTFTDVAEEAGLTEPLWSFPSWFWDFNNDGALDLYVAWYNWAEGGLAAVAASYLGLPGKYEPPRLYQGDGKGNFRDVAKQYKLTKAVLPMGSNFGDLENDGYLDFYLGTGYPDYESLMPNVLYRNQAGESFADVTLDSGFGHIQKGHAIAFADLDNDGDQDVFEQMGGFYPGDASSNVLYHNPGFENHWIAFRLEGVRSNRSAIGARIHVVILENGKQRSVYKHVNSGGTFGANPLRQTIGLGKAEKIVRVEIFWPTTGQTQTFANVEMDRIYRIKEDQKDLQ